MDQTLNLSALLAQVKQDGVDDLSDQAAGTILTTALQHLVLHIDLTYDEMWAVILLIMQGRCSGTMMGAILTALRMKGESVEEITAAASVMRSLASKVELSDRRYLVDIVGTGGDGANLFNVSTAAALVAASAGARVAKHGNRGVSTSSGSSDLLQQAGIRLDLDLDQTKACIESQNIGFLFAPNHHSAMRHAVGVRQTLKIRTLFNILGPLTNPADVPNLVVGVFTDQLCEPLAHVFKNLGANHVMVVGSKDGLDEISLATSTKVAELRQGEVSVYEIFPEDLGIESQSLLGLTVDSAKESLALIEVALSGEKFDSQTQQKRVQKARDMIAMNAGAAIYVSGRASNFANGVSMAQAVIHQGKALQKLRDFARFTQSLKAN